jgi:transcriptional regulator with XRE-family HTH domain
MARKVPPPLGKKLSGGGKKLRQWRASRAVPASDLAAQLGCSQREIYRWEFGTSTPNTINAAKLQRISRGELPMTVWAS